MRITEFPVKNILRAAAVTMIAAGASLTLQAQQSGLSTATSATGYPTLNFDPSAALRAAASDASESSSSSSSSTDAAPSLSGERDSLATSFDATQPPPRRRYGRRPNYSDNSHNPDGSNKLAIIAGVGFDNPVSDSRNTLTTNYDYQLGIGRNFSKKFAVLAEFNWNQFDLTGNTLLAQQNLYTFVVNSNNGGGADFTGLDATSHVWSFSLDPVFTFFDTGSVGAYATAGVGFYHKTANFTVPATGTYCDYIYGCYQYAANQTIDKYTSNAPGFDGGLGLTYKFSRFANERLYVEARYVYMANQQKNGLTLGTVNGTNYNSTANLFPANSKTTTYIPVTIGVRF